MKTSFNGIVSVKTKSIGSCILHTYKYIYPHFFLSYSIFFLPRLTSIELYLTCCLINYLIKYFLITIIYPYPSNTIKLDLKVIKSIFLGYTTDMKGCVLLDLKSKYIFTSRNASFYEHILSYKVHSPFMFIL